MLLAPRVGLERRREPLVSRRLPQKNLTSNPNLTQTPALNLTSGPGFISLRESERLSAGKHQSVWDSPLSSAVCSLPAGISNVPVKRQHRLRLAESSLAIG